jgi:hypothetical protein
MTTTRPAARIIGTTTDARGARRRRLGIVLVAALLLQTMLGVANELFTSVPTQGDPFAGAVPQWLLSLHVLVGTVVVVAAVVLAVSARRARDRAWTAPAVVGLVLVLGAWLSGHFFLVTYGDDALSLSMAVLGMTAIGVYVTGLVRSAAGSTSVVPTRDVGPDARTPS